MVKQFLKYKLGNEKNLLITEEMARGGHQGRYDDGDAVENGD